MKALVFALPLLLALPVLAGSVTLRPEAEVAGPYVRLGEVAEVSGDPLWKEVFLGAAPAAGATGRLRRQDVQGRLAFLGIRAEVDGAEETLLRPASFSDSARARFRETLRAEVERRLRAMPAGGLSLWHLGEGALELPADWSEAEVLDLESPPAQGGETPLRLRGRKAGGDWEEAVLRIPAIRVRRVVVAVQALRTHQVIGPQDLGIRELPESRIPMGTLGTTEGCLGCLVLKPVAPEGILLSSCLSAPRLVTRGSLCLLSERTGKVRVRCQGAALADGKLGEVVAFEILDSKKVVRARVSAAGEADLGLEEVPCAP